MNTDYFKYILEVARCRSITVAAENLHIQRAHLSKVIAAVEEELDITIFNRSPKGVLLTDAGQTAITQFQQIEDIWETIKNNGVNINDTAVYPQFFDILTFFFPPHTRPYTDTSQYLSTFQQKFPNVVLSLVDCEASQMADMLLTTPLSIAATLRTDLIPQLCQLLPEELVFLPVSDNVPLVALAGKNNQLAKQYQSISLATLAKQKLIFFDSALKEDSLEKHLFPSYDELDVRYYVSTTNLFYRLLDENDYFSLSFFSRDTEDDLLQIPIRDNIQIQLGFLYHKDISTNVVGKNFLDILFKHYTQKVKNAPFMNQSCKP